MVVIIGCDADSLVKWACFAIVVVPSALQGSYAQSVTKKVLEAAPEEL